MTFAEPVESLNTVSIQLREAEVAHKTLPKPVKGLLIEAADMLDDQLRRAQDLEAALALLRGLLTDWAKRLDEAAMVRIGQMDSPSRAEEKTLASQREVINVARLMRDAAERV